MILSKAQKIDSDEEVKGSGFYTGVFEDETMCIGDCRIQNIIVERGIMWHIKPKTLLHSFDNGKTWYSKEEIQEVLCLFQGNIERNRNLKKEIYNSHPNYCECEICKEMKQ